MLTIDQLKETMTDTVTKITANNRELRYYPSDKSLKLKAKRLKKALELEKKLLIITAQMTKT